MSTSSFTELSDIVLFLGYFSKIDEVVEMSNNANYVFQPPANEEGPDAAWLRGGSMEQPKTPVLYIAFGQKMLSPDGWVAGSAAKLVDIQLAPNNTTGVSKRHVRFDTSPLSHCPRVTCLGRSAQVALDGREPHLLVQNESIEIETSAKFDLGGISFRVWRPKLTLIESRAYRKKSLDFSKTVMDSLPNHFPSIDSGPETIMSNVRYGKRRVYVKQDIEAKGSTASVMLVRDRDTGEEFGAKEPYYKWSDDAGVRRQRYEELEQEFQHSSHLDHPYIVRAYELVRAGDDKYPPWLIMPYIPFCLIPQELDMAGTHRLATHMLSALAFLHSADITHRDLKPSNILVEDYEFKLADFGTTRHQVQQNMDTFTGSPLYLAPEFLEKPRSYTSKVDLFSFGLVLLECVSMWDAASDTDGADSVWNGQARACWMRKTVLPHVEGAPEEMRPLLRGLLRKRPEKRWSALHSLTWLHNHLNVDGDAGKRADASQEIIQQNISVTPPNPQHNRKRAASAALSERVSPRVPGNMRPPQHGEKSPLLPAFQWSPIQPPATRGPLSEVPSTLAPGAAFAKPQPPDHSPKPKGPTSELPSTAPFTTPPPPSPRLNTAADRSQGQALRSPYYKNQGASFAALMPQSPSWAATPNRDEGEFPISSEDNDYSAEESNIGLLDDWNEDTGEFED